MFLSHLFQTNNKHCYVLVCFADKRNKMEKLKQCCYRDKMPTLCTHCNYKVLIWGETVVDVVVRIYLHPVLNNVDRHSNKQR